MTDERVLRKPVSSRRMLAATACLAAAAMPALFGQGPPPPATAAPTAAAPATAQFEVADVHASPNVKYPFMDGGVLIGDRYFLREASMVQIISAAYHVDNAMVKGGPSWLDWDHFDIIAKAPPTPSKETIRLMLQSLLAQRFHLVFHTGTAPMPAHVLRAPGGKSKLKVSEGTGDAGCEPQPSKANQAAGAIPQILLVCHNETMEKFADDLRMMAGLNVVDSTGLKGTYDFNLKWTPQGLLARAGTDGISIFDAVDKQLGLELALETAPRPVLLVDSVDETPTPNLPDIAKRMPPPPPPQIEVATIKPSKPNERPMFMIKGDQMNGRAISLKDYITFAWEINSLDHESLVNAPKWLDEDKIDIVAKLADDDSAGAAPKAQRVMKQELQQLLRGIIEDRFQMKDHWENRPITVYHLVADNPKLTAADPKSRTRCEEETGPGGKDPRLTHPILDRLIYCQNVTMAQFGSVLQSRANGYIYNAVSDDTGLKGSYTFTLSFSSIGLYAPGGNGDSPPPSDGASKPSDPSGAVSLYDAVKNQLGVKLEKEKRSMPVLVIDHIEEQPTPN
jgi:uncharacterized protein (TIGR03435 family)